MSDHVIIQARDAMIAKLKADVTSVAERVYHFGEVQLEEVTEENSPFIAVQIGDDTDERVAINGSANDPAILEDMKVTFFVHCVAKADGDAEQAAYEVRKEVEASLLGSSAGLTLGGLIAMLTRVAAANNRDEATDQGAYNVALQFEAQIRHLESKSDSFNY